MVGWHHRLNQHEFEQSPVESEGQGGLAYCCLRGCKELDMTEGLNSNKSLKSDDFKIFFIEYLFLNFLNFVFVVKEMCYSL